MENMRAVHMTLDSGFQIDRRSRVSSGKWTFINNQYFFIQNRCYTFSNDRTGKTGTDYQIFQLLQHFNFSFQGLMSA